MRRLLMLTRPRSVADAIELLFDISFVWVVNGNSVEEKKLETRIKSLRRKLDKILQALEKSSSKKSTTKSDESVTRMAHSYAGHVVKRVT